MTHAPERRWLRLLLWATVPTVTLAIVVTVLTALAGWIGFDNSEGKLSDGKPIEFVVPPGFQGSIYVIKDSKKGCELELDRDRYVFNVPPNGIILVKNTRPFHQWHKEHCQDSDGHVRQLHGGVVTIRGNSADDDGATHSWEVR